MTQTKAELLQTRHQGDLKLGDADSSNYVGFKAPATVGSSLVWTLPATDGSANQFLQTNASGVLGWGTADVSSAMPLSGGIFTGDVTFDGATAGRDIVFDRSDNALEFADNAKATFGASADLFIFHDGSHSRINAADGGTGRLIISGKDGSAGDPGLQLNAEDSKESIICDVDAGVRLFHNGVKKIETSAAGIAITGAATISTNLTVTGDLTVSGTTTTINTQTLDVEDKNIVIGKVSTPSDTTADGGGITLKGASDKTINWVNSTDAWTFSEHINIAAGKKLGVGGANYGTSGHVLTSGGSGAAPSWAAVPPGGNTFTAVANGNIANNKAVKLDTDGKVSEIGVSVSDLSAPTHVAGSAGANSIRHVQAGEKANYQRMARISDTQYAVIWQNDDNNKVQARIITVSSDGNTFSTTSSLTSTPQLSTLTTDQYARDLDISYDTNRGKLLAVWTATSSRHCYGKVGTVSGTGDSAAITWGSQTTIRNGGSSDPTYYNKLVWNEDTQNFGYFCFTRGSDDKLYGRVVTINSSGAIEVGAIIQLLPFSNEDQPIQDFYSMDACYDTTNDRYAVFATGKYSDRYRSGGVCCSTSGSGTSATLTVLSSYQGNMNLWQYNDTSANGAHHYVHCCYDPSKDLVVVSYKDLDTTGNGHGHQYIKLFKCNSGNTDYSFGSSTTLVQSVATCWSIVYSPGIDKPVHVRVSTSNQIRAKIITISGTSQSSSISYSTDTIVESNQPWNTGLNQGSYQPDPWNKAVASASLGRIIYPSSFDSSGAAPREGLFIPIKVQNTVSNFTVADSYVGFADAAYTNGQTVTVKTVGNNVSTLSGLTIGSKYYVQTDGTVGTSAASPSAIAGIALAADKLLIREPT